MIKLAASILLASAVSAAAMAQQPPPPGSDQSPIVVTGGKTSKDSVRDFVRDLTPVTSGKGLSHFEHQVCPIVFGLAPHQNDMVEDRIRLVAKTAGIAVGGPKCSPNVVLIVASGKREVLEQLRRHHVDYFGDVSGNRIRELINSPERVLAWQIDGLPAVDGHDIIQDFGSGLLVNHTTARASRITSPAYPQFEAAVVIVEFDALDGLTITQLADYVAVRALTGANPAKLRNSAPPTILRAFDVPIGGEVPITLTEWDLSFLRGYYDARRNISAAAQRSAIAKTITDDTQPPQGK